MNKLRYLSDTNKGDITMSYNNENTEQKSNNSEFSNKSLPPYNDALTQINQLTTDSPDIIKKRVVFKDGKEGYVIYLKGLVNLELMFQVFISPILSLNSADLNNKDNVDKLPIPMVTYYYDVAKIVDEIFHGGTILIADSVNLAIGVWLKTPVKRDISEPIGEKSIKGPHEGFIEDISTNISLLRRNIKSRRLKFKVIEVGEITKQNVYVVYIEGIANGEVLNNLLNRIRNINIDALIDTGYIEQLVTDFPHSTLPQYQSTERTDKVIASLMEGKLAIMLDGTPTVSIVPVSFSAFFQAPDDYSSSWIAGFFIRLLRGFALILALFLPALYIAIVTFHYYAIPLDLLVPLSKGRARVPFTPIMEALFMEITIELLREAATRLPTYIGTTIGVVGGLVIGQAAVEAGIVGQLLLIVVAVTAIASYVIPNTDMALAIRLTRFAFMLLAGVFGMMGIIIGSSIFLAHLLVLESLGQPYFQPITPFKMKDLKDSFIRIPMKNLKSRPDIAKPSDVKRGKKGGK